MQITFQAYLRGSIEAVELYKKAFKLLSGKNMQFCITFGSGNEDMLKRAYEVLKEDSQILYPLGPCDWSKCMTDLIDKFGVRWYLSV